MSWPATIRVKLSSEAAGGISVTPVVVQELTPRELIEHLLGVAGKDELRIREILRRGTLVSSASRFRWEGWEPDSESLGAALASFPDSDPSQPFSRERCLRAVLHGSGQPLELSRDTVSRGTWLKRRSFWDTLLEVTGTAAVAYRGYSYRDRADCYLREYTPDEIERLRSASARIRHGGWRDRIRAATFSRAEFYIARSNPEAGTR